MEKKSWAKSKAEKTRTQRNLRRNNNSSISIQVTFVAFLRVEHTEQAI